MGGVGVYLDQVVPRLCGDEQGFAVRVVAPREHLPILAAIPRPWLAAFDRPRRSLWSTLALGRRTLEEMRRFRPDIVHAHSTVAGIVVRLMKLIGLTRARIVFTPHGWAFYIKAAPWKQAAVRWLERRLSGVADAIVMVSRQERMDAERAGFDMRRVVLVQNGVQADRLAPGAAPWADERLRVLFIGRLDAQKGFDILIQAARLAVDRVSVRVIGAEVVGGGGPAALPVNVESLGWLPRAAIEAELEACDVVAMPSRWEGLSLVSLEAMRAGRAVVASRVGGLPEVVVDGETGVLVAPGSAEALAAALTAHSRAEFAAMGERGRARFRAHFTLDRVVAELSEVYRAVLAGRPLPPAAGDGGARP